MLLLPEKINYRYISTRGFLDVSTASLPMIFGYSGSMGFQSATNMFHFPAPCTKLNISVPWPFM